MNTFELLRRLAALQQSQTSPNVGLDYDLNVPQPMVPVDNAPLGPRGPQLGRPTVGSQFMPQRPRVQENPMQDPAIQGFLAGLAAVPGAKLPNMDTAAPKSAVTSTVPPPPSPRKVAASAKRAKVGAKLGRAANQADSTALLNSLALELAKGSIDYNQFMAALEKERTTRGTANRTYQGLLEGV